MGLIEVIAGDEVEFIASNKTLSVIAGLCAVISEVQYMVFNYYPESSLIYIADRSARFELCDIYLILSPTSQIPGT